MLNKEMLLTSAQETEVKITLEVYHAGGDYGDVQMYYNYIYIYGLRSDRHCPIVSHNSRRGNSDVLYYPSKE